VAAHISALSEFTTVDVWDDHCAQIQKSVSLYYIFVLIHIICIWYALDIDD
jgi:hypothetical protein